MRASSLVFVLALLAVFARATPTFAAIADQTCAQTDPSLEDLNRPVGNFKLNPDENTRWLRAPTAAPRGIVLLIHGLNIRPSRMDQIGQVLNNEGFDVLRVALAGHRGSQKEFRKVTHELWLEETFLSYCVARREASTWGVPLAAIGFSLGGALVEDLLNEAVAERPVIDRAVLFAPAISLTLFTKLGGFLNIFGKGFLLPSQIIGGYRANDWVPMAAYDATIDTARAARKTGLGRSNIPTLVFGDPHDELVSAKGVIKLAVASGLGHWIFQRVKISPPKPFQFKLHHIIIDEEAMGADQWGLMTYSMLEQLEAP